MGLTLLLFSPQGEFNSVSLSSIADAYLTLGGGGGAVVRWCWVNFHCRSVNLD